MKRALIVEDQADIRELIRMTLELEDMEIHEAENGDAGWVVAQKLLPDLILLDVMMPGVMDGFDVCKLLRADPRLRCANSCATMCARRSVRIGIGWARRRCC